MNTTTGGGPAAPGSVKDRQLVVLDNEAACCFEIYVDRQLAGYLRYRIEHGTIWLIETTVSRQYRIDNLVPHLFGEGNI